MQIQIVAVELQKLCNTNPGFQESEKVKQRGKAGVVPFPASCTEILPIELFPSLSPLPQGPEELCW